MPAAVLRPTKTSDGEGGFTEVFAEPRTIFLEGIAFHENQITAVVDAFEDVKIDDVLELEDLPLESD